MKQLSVCFWAHRAENECENYGKNTTKYFVLSSKCERLLEGSQVQIYTRILNVLTVS